MDRVLDKSCRPEDCRIDFNPRQAGLHLLQRLLHPSGDGERVAPGEFLDDEHEAWAVVDDGIANHALRCIDEIGHVAQQQRRLTVRVGHRHPGQRLRGNAAADEAELKALIGCFDEAAGTDMRAAGIAQQTNIEGIRNRFLHLVERNVRLGQALRVNHDLKHLELLSPDRDVRNAGNPEQPLPDGPIGQHRQVHHGLVLGGDADLHDPAGGGQWRHHERRRGPCRQGLGRERHPLADQLPRADLVGAGLEDQQDRRQLRHRLRTHHLDIRDTVQRVFQRHRDKLLDFGG